MSEPRASRVDDFTGVVSWRIAGYDDVRELLADRRLSKDLRNAGAGRAPERATRAQRTLLNTDPPDHTRLRRLVSKAFSARRIEGLRGRVQVIVDELLEALAGRDEVDLVGGFALPLPIMVICELIGVPAEDRARFQTWFSPESAPGAREGWWGEGARYLAELVARRRPSVRTDLPEDEQPDLLSVLIAGRDAAEALTEDEMIGTLTLLLIAGHETSINLIASGMLALLLHPDQLRTLRERPELMPSAVEELLRYTSPLQRGSFRFATEDITLGDVTIPAGGVVTMGLAAANRDPSQFPEPDRLDLARTDNRHLAFGHGVHFCLGAPLARVEGQVAFASLLRRFPDIALACPPEEVRWRPQGFLRGLAALPVRLR